MDNETQPNPNTYRAETKLAHGTDLTIEVCGPEDRVRGQRVAELGLKAATNAILATDELRKTQDAPATSYGRLVGSSPPMDALYRMLTRIEGSAATVLITGENGTGKELVAKSIHEQSDRNDKPFVATNCSAFNDNLLESELFGHRRGAFTGAVHDKPGLFQVADKGTFFLDEVGDMSQALQVKLLRVLQEGTINPVGGTETKSVNVRILAATNRHLKSMVREGSFREDLYYRLHVVALEVPPLRDRRGDIPRLVDFFLSRLGDRYSFRKELHPNVLTRLMTHTWPGNVRELENEIERMWVLSGDDRLVTEEFLTPGIGRGTFPPAIHTNPNAAHIDYSGKTLPEAVEELEKRMIICALEQARGNRTKASGLLGVSRRNLIRKVQAYGLEQTGRSKENPA